MKPVDVPDELLLEGLKSAINDGRDLLTDYHSEEIAFLEDALCAVLPAHEARVRAKVAAELLEQGNKVPLGSGFRRGLRAAAQFANPPSIEDAARAIQDAYGRYERGEPDGPAS